MLGRKSTNIDPKLGSKLNSSYPHQLGGKISLGGKLESIGSNAYQSNYIPVKDGQNLFNHRSPLERKHHAN
jgi:hypothetical protein